MSRESETIVNAIRTEFLSSGCKKAGHIDYFIGADDSLMVCFFTKIVGKQQKIETSIDLRVRALNELSFFISEYGTTYRGKEISGPFPGRFKIGETMHVSGPCSFSMFRYGQEVVLAGSINEHVVKCMKIGKEMISSNGNIGDLVAKNLNREPPVEDVVVSEIFLENFQSARKIVESNRLPDGGFIRSFLKKSDQYLASLGC
ncbi:hypothetical protein AB4Y96_13150 [Phyllobacterium sp. TAF24]|uniref:hypothetical protein n=1 Tax=Phyllobacterium sp. TAF24 TaxID=3233068 RepID=UPI003F9A6884